MNYADALYAGIANGRVLTVELYTHRSQNLFYLHFVTDLFGKDIFTRFRIKALILKHVEVS